MVTDPHLLVRWLHVVAAAILVGSAVALALASWALRTSPQWPVACARAEWAFWGALGLLLATGVGNLGELGSALPPPDSRWGVALTAKMALVVLLVVLSAVRALLLVRAYRGAPTSAPVAGLYGGAAVLGVVALGFAQVLAHG